MTKRFAFVLLLGLVVPLGARAQDDVEDPDAIEEPPPAEDEPAPEPEPEPVPEPEPTVEPPPPTPPARQTVEDVPVEPEDEADADADYWNTMIFQPGMQAFAEYDLDLYDDGTGSTTYFHQFDVPRVFLWANWQLGDVRARLLLEGARSAGAGSLIGVAGDSVVVRFREAWAGYRAWDLFELRLGFVRTPIAPAMTEAWGLRPVAQTALRRFEVMQPADLGATLTFDIPEGFGQLGVGFYNGEGYRGRELNRGKNSEFFGQIHPLAFVEELRPLTVIAGYQLGSSGTGSARSDRLVGALAWMGERIGGGVGATWVLGLFDRGGQEGALIEAWARGNPWEGLIVGGRFQHFIRDFGQDTDTLTEFTLSVGYRVHEVVGAHLAFDGRLAGDTARAALPGYERWRIRVIAEATFEHPFTVTLGGD